MSANGPATPAPEPLPALESAPVAAASPGGGGPPPAAARWLALGLGLCWLVPLWWLVPGLWAGWWLGGRGGTGLGPRPNADERLLAALPFAFALPALFLPLARLLRLPWQQVWMGLAAAGALAGLRRLGRRMAARPAAQPGPPPAPLPAPLPAPDEPSLWPGTAMALAALLAFLYFLPLRGMIAPPGVDMTMHLTFARLLWQSPTIPTTQAPIFPGVPLGAYPLGFHAGAALTARLTGDVLAAGLFVTAAAHALLPIAVYLCCRPAAGANGPGRAPGPDGVRRSGLDRPAAAAALLAAWLSRNPQEYVAWGGNPCVLGTALALVALRWLLAPDAVPGGGAGARWASAAGAGLLMAAVALVHPTPAALLPYAVLLALPTLVWLGLARADGAMARRLLLAVLAAAAVLLPQLPAVRATEVSADEATWVRLNHRLPPQAPEPGLSGLARYYKGQYDDAMAALFAALLLFNLAALRRWRVEAALAGAQVSLLLLAALAARWRLPPALALYSERMMPWALPLFALALIRSFAAWRALPLRPPALRRTVTLALVLALAALAAAKHRHFYSHKAAGNALVTEADRLAFAWLAVHAPTGSVIDTNRGDAGAYLPAALGLAVTRPQTNPVWFEEMSASLGGPAASGAAPSSAGAAAFRYHGARSVIGEDETGPLIRPEDVVFKARARGRTATVARVPRPPDLSRPLAPPKSPAPP